MGTIYTLLTVLSIVGIKIVEIILSIIFDSVAFSLAWKIGGNRLKCWNSSSFALDKQNRHICHFSYSNTSNFLKSKL